MTANKKSKGRNLVQRVKSEWKTFYKEDIPRFLLCHIKKIFIGIPIFAVFFLIIWLVPKFQATYFEPSKSFKLENEARKTITQALAGLLVLFGLYTALRRAKATEAQVKAIEEGQVTERFTRAIDQLGNKDSMEVRLGGIYALDSIGKDSPKYRLQIIEVLTAYIRNNAGNKDVPESEADSNKKQEVRELNTDIKAIFSILYNENGWPMEFKKQDNLRYDFRHSDFSYRNMERMPLNNCQLLEANFCKASLQRVNLQVALLAGADLRGTDLRWANLQEAVFRQAILQGASLMDANFQETDFRWANLQEANLQRSHLQGADLQGTDLRGTDLRWTKNLRCSQVNSVKSLDKETKFPDYLEVKITGENEWICKEVDREMDLDLGDQIDNP